MAKPFLKPLFGAPHDFIYDNNGNKGQFQCKVCAQTFNESNHVTKPIVFVCHYCSHTLVPKKDRKHFQVHKCVDPKCSYYRSNLAKLPKDLYKSEKHRYKFH